MSFIHSSLTIIQGKNARLMPDMTLAVQMKWVLQKWTFIKRTGKHWGVCINCRNRENYNITIFPLHQFCFLVLYPVGTQYFQIDLEYYLFLLFSKIPNCYPLVSHSIANILSVPDSYNEITTPRASLRIFPYFVFVFSQWLYVVHYAIFPLISFYDSASLSDFFTKKLKEKNVEG